MLRENELGSKIPPSRLARDERQEENEQRTKQRKYAENEPDNLLITNSPLRASLIYSRVSLKIPDLIEKRPIEVLRPKGVKRSILLF